MITNLVKQNDRQFRKKHNIRFSRDKERASYFSQMNFKFNKAASHPLTEDDNIVVLNMHMNVSTIKLIQIHYLSYEQLASKISRTIDPFIKWVKI